MIKFTFASVASKIQANAVKMMDNHVVPAAGRLDDKIAIAVPVAQAHAAGLAAKLAEQANKLSEAANNRAKSLNAKAEASLAALPAQEVVAPVAKQVEVDGAAMMDWMRSLTPDQRNKFIVAVSGLEAVKFQTPMDVITK